MSQIVDDLKPNAVVLFNESFASTKERGRKIVKTAAKPIVRASVAEAENS